MPFTVKKVGDWDKVEALFNFLTDGSFKEAIKDKLREDGDLIVDSIKNHITAQDLGWTPLAESTLKKKQGTMIYVETGQLLNSITQRDSNTGDMSIEIGAEGEHSSGISNDMLLTYLEYGTNKIPPRPLIRPTFEEYQNKSKNDWISFLKDLLRG